MKNIKASVTNARLMKEWTLRLRQLAIRRMNRLSAARADGTTTELVEAVQRQIDAAFAHLRAFDWEKKR